MERELIKKQRIIEFAIWMAGVLGILLVILYQRNLISGGYRIKPYFPYILLASVILLCTSLILKIRREKKKRRFSIFNYTREILRTLAGVGFAIYALIAW